ncbi:MAG: nuclear transport factor 2 family protein [Actinomycetota bacterium]|nr:nuclear transport factor 2 family protein [Actinomycetota bacterium]
MEAWELDAREQIRGLVAAYNALGDRGRFDAVMALFAEDAVMDVGDGRSYEGLDQIRTIFTGTRDSILDRDEDSGGGGEPRFLQHHTTGLHITMGGRAEANGHSYFTVMTDRGVDHWGRYQDAYWPVDGYWRFSSRRVRIDGTTPGGWADRRLNGPAT